MPSSEKAHSPAGYKTAMAFEPSPSWYKVHCLEDEAEQEIVGSLHQYYAFF